MSKNTIKTRKILKATFEFEMDLSDKLEELFEEELEALRQTGMANVIHACIEEVPDNR